MVFCQSSGGFLRCIFVAFFCVDEISWFLLKVESNKESLHEK